MKTGSLAADWLHSPRGEQLLRAERARLDPRLAKLFGRTLLQIGDWGDDLLRPAPHWRTGVIGTGGNVQVICDLGALPLVPHSADAILLAHSLEAAPSPHRLLREADTALTSRGQLLILGFNPYSWWGLRQRWLPAYPALPPRQQLLGSGRITDWLRLLDYEVVCRERFGPVVPRGPRWLQPLLAPFAPAYLIHARKRQIPVNPIRKPAWRRAPADASAARLGSVRSAA